MLPLLWIGMLFFYSRDVLADEKADKFEITITYGACPGNMPSKSPTLRPHVFYLLVTDPKTGVIRNMAYLPPADDKWDQPTIKATYHLGPSAAFPYQNVSQVHVLMYVKTAMDQKMSGIDNQVFYGLPPDFDVYKTGGKVLQELGDSPFRINGFRVKHIHKDGKETILFEAEGECSTFDEKAWIANHGLYRVCKKTKAARPRPVFENLYYMPEVGKHFEAKCISQ